LVLLTCFPLIFSQSSKIDLITKASGARWKNDIGILNLPFPGKANDSRGFVRLITAQLEDGETASNVLQTHPRWAARGSIEGQYQITIPENAKFEAEVGFIQGAKATDGVIFEVVWRERGKADIILGSIEKKYTGNLSTFDIDLGNLAGQTGLFILRVRAGQSAAQDWAVWKSAAIISGMPGAASMPKAKEPIQIKQPPVKVVKPIPPEAQIRISEIEDANKKIARYRIRGHVMPSGLQFEGIVDQQKKSLYYRLTLPTSQDISAEFYQIGNKGYGRISSSQNWLNIQVSGEMQNFLIGAVEVMKSGKIISVREEGQLLKHEVVPENLPPRDNPNQFFNSLFKQPASPQLRAVVNRMIEMSRDLKISVYISVSSRDKRIRRIEIENESPRMKASSVLTIDETKDEVPTLPKEALKAKGPAIPWPMLIFRLPEYWGIGGWNDFVHCNFALGALKLLENVDKDEKYAEIYRIAEPQCGWDGSADKFMRPEATNHPILLGTYYEDQKSTADDVITFYKEWFGEEFKELGLEDRFNTVARRPYHHYGGENQGVEYKWYYELWPPVPDRPCNGDRFYSARDWGFGGNRTGDGTCSPPVEDLNPFTFIEAIKQYNKSTTQGKKNAYFMLGHVIHLLQDQAEPDHAKLVPHPGSGFTEPEMYDQTYLCEILAAEAALDACGHCMAPLGPLGPLLCGDPLILATNPCTHAAFTAAEGACRASINPNEVGFEWLAEHRWTLSRIEPQLRGLYPSRRSDYDAFFRSMAYYAIDAVKRHGFSADYDNENSLGTGHLPIIPEVPAADPDIDLRNSDKVNRYLRMIDDLAIFAIREQAGLLQYFYEIVNPPPYLKRLTITQGSETRFDVTWDDIIENNSVIRRNRNVRKNYTLYHGVPAIITAWFGPDSIIGPDPEKDPKHVRTRDMQGGNVYIDGQRVSLSRSIEDGNPVLRGSFIPGCIREINPITTSISIDALDDAPHLQSRNPLGNSLDKDPSTVAGARAYPPHDWINYEQDSDPFHLYVPIKIGIPDALIDFVSVEGGRGFYEGYDPDLHVGAHLRAGAGEGAIVSLRLLERESGQPIITDPEQGECGYYSFYIPPTIEVIGQTTEAMVGGRVVHVPLVVSPTQVGFTIHIDGARSNQPKLHIDVDPEAQSGRYRIPLIINYEFRDGHTDQIYRLDLEFQVLNIWETDKENRANENAANLLGLKDLVRAKKLGFLDIREGPPVAFDPCKVGVSSPEWCFLRDPFQLREVRIVPDREVAFSSLTSQMRKITISAIKLNIRPDERDPHIIYFEAGPQLAPGTYLISFKVMMGNKQLDRFLVMAAVTK